MNGQMLTSVTQIAWWCGGMGPYFRSHLRARAGLFPRSALAPLKRSHQQQWCGEKGLLRKAWRVPSQPLARESSAAPTNSLGASTAPSSTTVVRGKGSASQRLAREIAAPCARKQFCSHALLWRLFTASPTTAVRTCLLVTGAQSSSAATLCLHSPHVLGGEWESLCWAVPCTRKQCCSHALTAHRVTNRRAR